MNKPIRIMLGHSTYDGDDFAVQLLDEGVASFCYNASSYHPRRKNDDKLISFDFTVGHMNTYENVCDFNSLPSLDEDILEAMRPYESMAIKLGARMSHFPVVDYEREKARYLRSLRFWNNELNKHKIDLMFFDMTPHFQYNFILYCLAKIKDISILLMSYTVMSKNIRTLGTRIDEIGKNIESYYKRVASKMSADACVLEGEYKSYFEKYAKGGKTVAEQRQAEGFYEKKYLESREFFYHNFFGKNKILYPERQRIKMGLIGIKRRHDEEWRVYNANIEAQLEDYNLIRYYMKHRLVYKRDYDRKAIEPDLSKDYIFYPLQYYPEDNSLPRNGVFTEQYLSVQMVARAARKRKMYVYVKEHFVQPFREKSYYDQISSIPNVRMVKTTVNSMDLIENCVAVATVTGSAILEGAILGKAALVTGDGNYWKGIPNLFKISNEQQALDAIDVITSDFRVDIDVIKRYFYSIQKQTIRLYDPTIFDEMSKNDVLDLVRTKIKLIEKYLENDMDVEKTMLSMTE